MTNTSQLENCWSTSLTIKAGEVALSGNLCLPDLTSSLVVFVHGSGSSRHSPRNQYVAQLLNQANLGTLLFDLLTPREEEVDLQTARLRFDIGMLAERVQAVTQWLHDFEKTARLRIGYFGASTGAAAALVAAAALPGKVAAIVSRGGRPDLAGAALTKVEAPTLLIVGKNDLQVLNLNRVALRSIRAEKQLSIVPGAGHLFEEPGTLKLAADLACNWFQQHMPARIVEYDTYFCDNCRKYLYNEASGDAEHHFHPGTLVEQFPAYWQCPLCGADKEQLRPSTMVDGFGGG